MMYILVPALIIQTIGAILYFIVFADSSLAPKIYGATKIILFALPLLMLWKGYRFGPFLPKNKIASSITKGLLFGLAVGAAMFGLTATFSEYFLSLTPKFIDAVVSLGIQNHFILFAIFLSLAHSLFEEYYWRWFIFGGLKTAMPIRTAALISSAAFSAHHFIVLSQLFPLSLTVVFGLLIFAGGLFWCWLYNRSGNLWGNWLSHAILDATVMAIAYQLIQVYLQIPL